MEAAADAGPPPAPREARRPHSLPVDSVQRCEVIFHGHVQGVGFRFTTDRVAKRYSITGYVENARDGTVHLVAEGLRKDVSSLIQGLLGQMVGYVTRHEETWLPATGEFEAFGIRQAP